MDALVAKLVPTRTSRNATEVDALVRLLGLEPVPGASAWPSQTEVAASLDVSRARVGQVLVKARERWRKLAAVEKLRGDLLDHLATLGTVATASELERAVLADRATGDPDMDRGLARAAVRAAVEVELAATEPRLAQRRTHDGRVLLASTGNDAADRQRALDHTLRLGAIADELAAGETLAAPAEVAARLTKPAAPPGLQGLSRDRLVALAAAASTGAAASARLELHPRHLPAERALTLGRGALLGNDAISTAEIRRRIAARFPHAQPLPDRPELDRLLEDGGFDLRWDPELDAYVAPQRVALTGLTSHESSIGRLATANVTTIGRPKTDPQVVEALAFEQRLRDAQRAGGMLSLMAFPQELPDAGRQLRRLGVTVIDLDELLIRQLHAAASDLGISDWNVVLTADAEDHASVGWTNLGRLVQRAMPAIEDHIATSSGTVLLENVGLLSRYGELGLFDRLRQRIMDGAPLRACWTLIPADDQTDRPAIDGHGIPVLTPNEWSRIPRPWLRNLHRAAVARTRMIEHAALLATLKPLVTTLEASITERALATPEVAEHLEQEHRKAVTAKRTAMSLEEWREGEITQAAVAWVLACVFVRFLEDNGLIDQPLISGPGARRAAALGHREEHFRAHPEHSDREYLEACFREVARFPAVARCTTSSTTRCGDSARPPTAPASCARRSPRSTPTPGCFVHDFTDAELGTRFLGDLYQDLSETAKKRYALLQTPDFVERFILDRTLTPAIDGVRARRDPPHRPDLRIGPLPHRRVRADVRALAGPRTGNRPRGPRAEVPRPDRRRRPQPVRDRDRPLPARSSPR